MLIEHSRAVEERQINRSDQTERVLFRLPEFCFAYWRGFCSIDTVQDFVDSEERSGVFKADLPECEFLPESVSVDDLLDFRFLL